MYAEKLIAYLAEDVQRVYIWPANDKLELLRLFHERVDPEVDDVDQ